MSTPTFPCVNIPGLSGLTCIELEISNRRNNMKLAGIPSIGMRGIQKTLRFRHHNGPSVAHEKAPMGGKHTKTRRIGKNANSKRRVSHRAG